MFGIGEAGLRRRRAPCVGELFFVSKKSHWSRLHSSLYKKVSQLGNRDKSQFPSWKTGISSNGIPDTAMGAKNLFMAPVPNTIYDMSSIIC